MFWVPISARPSKPRPIRFRRRNDALEKIDAVIDIEKLQQPDGYLEAVPAHPAGLRWTNLRDCHELYCAGHLIEGAVAYYRPREERKLLDVVPLRRPHRDRAGAGKREGLLRP
jgi:DUF1680 family protein